MKTKKAYETVLAQAVNLVDQVQSCERWSWANNEHNLAGVSQARAALKEALCPFAKQFLATELPVLRKSYEESTLVSMCSKFCLDLDDRIAKLTMEIRTLVATTRGRASVCGRVSG